MNSTALHALFRSEMRDEAQPYLWSDVDIYRGMSDAQTMFCRLTGGITDSTTALTQLSVAANTEWAALDPRIQKIRAARDASGRDIQLLNYEQVQGQLRSTPGTVRALITGMDNKRMRLHDIPAIALTISLTIDRMPLADITTAAQEFEIDPHHHVALLHWMKHLALLKQDAETYDRGRSLEEREMFELYCERARAERVKREHTFRTVKYGGL